MDWDGGLIRTIKQDILVGKISEVLSGNLKAIKTLRRSEIAVLPFLLPGYVLMALVRLHLMKKGSSWK